MRLTPRHELYDPSLLLKLLVEPCCRGGNVGGPLRPRHGLWALEVVRLVGARPAGAEEGDAAERALRQRREEAAQLETLHRA